MSTKIENKYVFTKNFLSGGLAGIISKTIVAPIERVKLLMQTQRENDKIKKPYKGMIDCFIRCIRQEGVLSLWRGNWVNVVRYFPTQALGFSFKDYFNHIFHGQSFARNQKINSLIILLLSGGFSGIATTLFVHPLDYARTRIGVDIGKQLSERQFIGMNDCLRKTYQIQGIRGLYRGFGISVPSIFLYRALYFGIYDFIRDFHLKSDTMIIIKFLYAQITVMLSQLISYPGDTIKRKMMIQSLKPIKQYTGTLQCIIKVYRMEGILGFWKGAFTNAVRSIGSSLCLVLYDQLLKLSSQISSTRL